MTVALVLGAGGIGAAIAHRFAAQGMTVYAATRSGAPVQGCTALACDVRDAEKVRQLVDRILREQGRIDVLVNAVSPQLKLKTFDQLTDADFADDVSAILGGAITACKQIVPAMQKQKSGLIISLSTAAVKDAPARMASYVAAKAGLDGFMRVLSRECSAHGIRVVTITPSYVETRLISAFPPKLLEIERSKQPGQQFLQPEDIAQVALAIAGDPAAYPNGAEVVLRSRADLEAAQ
jgi:NAD(P)-dependent dehydrogenase (short-subunit alcohol dehydrogenase family)